MDLFDDPLHFISLRSYLQRYFDSIFHSHCETVYDQLKSIKTLQIALLTSIHFNLRPGL